MTVPVQLTQLHAEIENHLQSQSASDKEKLKSFKTQLIPYISSEPDQLNTTLLAISVIYQLYDHVVEQSSTEQELTPSMRAEQCAAYFGFDTNDFEQSHGDLTAQLFALSYDITGDFLSREPSAAVTNTMEALKIMTKLYRKMSDYYDSPDITNYQTLRHIFTLISTSLTHLRTNSRTTHVVDNDNKEANFRIASDTLAILIDDFPLPEQAHTAIQQKLAHLLKLNAGTSSSTRHERMQRSSDHFLLQEPSMGSVGMDSHELPTELQRLIEGHHHTRNGTKKKSPKKNPGNKKANVKKASSKKGPVKQKKSSPKQTKPPVPNQRPSDDEPDLTYLKEGEGQEESFKQCFTHAGLIIGTIEPSTHPYSSLSNLMTYFVNEWPALIFALKHLDLTSPDFISMINHTFSSTPRGLYAHLPSPTPHQPQGKKRQSASSKELDHDTLQAIRSFVEEREYLWDYLLILLDVDALSKTAKYTIGLLLLALYTAPEMLLQQVKSIEKTLLSKKKGHDSKQEGDDLLDLLTGDLIPLMNPANELETSQPPPYSEQFHHFILAIWQPTEGLMQYNEAGLDTTATAPASAAVDSAKASANNSSHGHSTSASTAHDDSRTPSYHHRALYCDTRQLDANNFYHRLPNQPLPTYANYPSQPHFLYHHHDYYSGHSPRIALSAEQWHHLHASQGGFHPGARNRHGMDFPQTPFNTTPSGSESTLSPSTSSAHHSPASAAAVASYHHTQNPHLNHRASRLQSSIYSGSSEHGGSHHHDRQTFDHTSPHRTHTAYQHYGYGSEHQRFFPPNSRDRNSDAHQSLRNQSRTSPTDDDSHSSSSSSSNQSTKRQRLQTSSHPSHHRHMMMPPQHHDMGHQPNEHDSRRPQEQTNSEQTPASLSLMT